MLTRAGFALALSVALLGVSACGRSKRDARAVERCELCGMKIDPASAWTTELVRKDGEVVRFDTPRCAFASLRRGKTEAVALRAQEFYERTMVEASELRFVVGSDVIGPMGPDLVPVAPSRADKFVADHGGTRVLTGAEVTLDVVEGIH